MCDYFLLLKLFTRNQENSLFLHSEIETLLCNKKIYHITLPIRALVWTEKIH